MNNTLCKLIIKQKQLHRSAGTCINTLNEEEIAERLSGKMPGSDGTEPRNSPANQTPKCHSLFLCVSPKDDINIIM